MGVMRFQTLDGQTATAAELAAAYLSGFDGRVYPATVTVDDGLVTLRRNGTDSGRLHVAWPVTGAGRPVLCTAALCERPTPYLLPVELARGQLGLIRDQLAAWQAAGMEVPSEAAELLTQAQGHFCRAACRQEHPSVAAEAADAALAAALAAAERLTASYVRQRLTLRRRRTRHLPVLLSSRLGPERPPNSWNRPFAAAFTGACVNAAWREVEPRQGEYAWEVCDQQVDWCHDQRLTPVGNAMLDFSPGGLPDWLWPYAQNYAALQSFVCDYVETVVSRYMGRVRLWEVAARANTGGALLLDEEHRLALTARAVEVARQVDDDLRLNLRVEQPWGAYQAAGMHRLSPLQSVDALVRSGVGLTGITLELAVGFTPGGSAIRDRFEISRLIDLWSSLGLTLTVSLAFPSQHRRDVQAAETIGVAEPQWRQTWSDEAQADWAEELLPLLMSKPAVNGIEWMHFSDAVPHRFPHAGLLRPDGSAKPALGRLTRYRQSYWSDG